jgi:hypothetical protein
MSWLSPRYVTLPVYGADERHITDVNNGLITSYIPDISILRV